MIKKKESKLLFLSALFIMVLVLSNIVTVKLINFGTITLTAGILVFPLTFLLTDVINEVWGKKLAMKIVIYGFIINVIAVALLQLTVHWPASPYFAEMQPAYAAIMGAAARITLASMVAYLITQLYDVWVFDKLKQKTEGKHLWLRNNVSTMTAQIMDSIIFVSIAFYGVLPNEVLMSMIFGQWIAKWIIAAADTPFCYLLVNWAREEKVTG